MRLVCPNCGAQYEVPNGVIPDDGRDVQCSNCGNTWFEPHPDAVAAAREQAAAAPPPPPAPEPAPAPEPEFEPPEPPQPPQPPKVDPSVADVLRQEAEFEARARAAETGGSLETQPDLGLDDPDEAEANRAREAADHKARMRGEPPIAEAVAATVAADAARPRREQLPDIEDINATLRSSKEPRLTDRNDPPPHIQAAAQERGKFRRGFMTVLLIAIILIALYVFAPRISEMVPALKGPLDQYVAVIDQARVWLDTQVNAGLQWLDSMASEASASDEPAAEN